MFWGWHLPRSSGSGISWVVVGLVEWLWEKWDTFVYIVALL